MKTLLAYFNNPVIVLLHSVLGTAAIAYLEHTATQALLWLVPCIFIILADLAAGVNAAKYRGETVRCSSAMRRTLNKTLCYSAWILTCVALNERYHTDWVAWAGMGVVFFVEGLSFISNVIEPHGYKISIHGILRVLGSKTDLDGLGDVVQKQDKTPSPAQRKQPKTRDNNG